MIYSGFGTRDAMKVTQEKLPASQVGLEIEVTPEMSRQAYEKTLQEFTRHANIPGFRKGKVPRQVLIQRFGSTRIKMAVLEDLIQDSLQKALEQEKIEAIGNFELKSSFDDLIQQFEPGSAITFSAAIDVQPEVSLTQYKGLTVQAEEIKYDPDRVNQVLEDYRKRAATLVPVEGRSAQADDVATVDFSGRIDEEVAEGEEPQEIPGGSAQDFELELSEGRFIPGFIDGIIGMSVGETKEVSATFPQEYPQAELAGKPAIFTVTLKELKERELPELDDDFAQEISEFETLDALKESLESRYRDEAEQKTKTNKQEALLQELVKHLEADLPETLIKREADYSITQTAMRLSEQGLDIKKAFTSEVISALRQQARPEAIDRLQRTFALGEVSKQESIKVEADEIEAKVQEFLADYSGGEVDIDRLRQVVEEDLLKDKILGWLEEQNTIELVPEGTLAKEEPDPDALLEGAEEPLADTVAVAASEPQATDDESEDDESEIESVDAGTATVEVEATEVPTADAHEDVEAIDAQDSSAEEASNQASKSSSTSKKSKKGK
jgi:trigger factor